LTGSNSYQGGTFVNGGMLVVSNAYALGGGTATVSGGTTLNLAGFNQTIAGLYGSGSVTNASNTLTLNISGTNDTFGGVIAGGGGVALIGGGTLTLGNTNSYVGGTLVSNATLALGTNNALSTNGSVTVTNSGGVLNLAGFSQIITGLFGNGVVTNTTGTNSTLTLNVSSNDAFAGTIVGSNALVVAGTGTVTLSASNSYNGGTTVSNTATLVLTNNGTMGSGTATVASGTLNIGTNGVTSSYFRISSGLLTNSLTGGGTLTAATYELNGGTVAANLGTGSITVGGSATLSGTAGASNVSVTSGGFLTVSGAGRFTNTASVVVGNGTLSLGSNQTIDTFTLNGGTLTNVGAASLTATSTYNLNGGTVAAALGGAGSLTVGGSTTLSATAGATNVAITNGTLTLAGGGFLTNTALLTVTNTGTLNLSGKSQTLAGLSGNGSVTNTTGGMGTLTLNIAASTNDLFTGSIGGSNALTKSGTGTLTLSGTNTYSGVTTINGGQLAITTNTAIGTNSLTITNGSFNYAVGSSTLTLGGLTLNGNATIYLTNSSYITNTGAVTITNSGNTISLLGAGWSSPTNTLMIGTSLNVANGSITLDALNSIGFTPLALGASAYVGRTQYSFLSNATSLYLTVTGVAGNLYWGTNTGGNWNTTDANWSTNSGGGGTLGSFVTLDNVTFGNLATNGPINVTANLQAGAVAVTNSGTGTVTLYGANITASSFTKSNAGALVVSNSFGLNGGGFTNSGSGAVTIAGSFTNGSLVQGGSGTIFLLTNNSYTGGTTLNAGALAISNNTSFGSGTVTFASNSTTVSALTSLSVANAYVISNAVTGTFDVGSSLVLTNSGLISGGGSLAKAGAGTLVLSGANTYSGGTLVTNGTLALAASGTMGSTNGTVTISNSGTIDIANRSVTNGSFAIYGGGILTNSGGTGTLTAATYALNGGTVAANLGTGTLTVAGAATLSGTSAATNVTLSSGTLTLAGGINRLYTNAQLTNNAVLDIAGNNQTLSGVIGSGTVTSTGAGTLTLNIATTNTYSGVLSGGLSLESIGLGTLTLNSSNGYSGNTRISYGTVVVGASNALGNGVITITNGGSIDLTFVGNNALTNTFEGNGTISKIGSGTVTMGNNTAGFNGTFEAASNGSTIFITSTNYVSSGASFIAGNGGNVAFSNSANMTFANDLSVTNTNAQGNFDNLGAGTVTLSGNLAKNGTDMAMRYGTFLILGKITGTNNVSGAFDSDFGADSNGTVIIASTNNDYFGYTFARNGGTVVNGTNNALPSNTVVLLGATNDYAGATNRYDLAGNNQTIAGLSSIGTAVNIVTNSSNTVTSSLTLGGATNTSFGGLISGNLALTRSGTGTTTITGNNTYTGGTTISGGKMIAASSSALGNGALQLNGGTLVIDTPVLTLPSMTWSNSGIIALTAQGNYLNLTNSINALTFAGGATNGFTFNVSGFNTPGSIKILTATNLSTNDLSVFDVTGLGSGYTYALSLLGGSLFLDLTQLTPAYPNFMAYAATYNQQQVAGALNTWVANNPSGDQTNVLSALTALTNSPSEMQSAFNQIAPTMYQSLSTIAFNLANAQNSELAQRLWNQRVAESGGFSMNGFADNTPIWEGLGDGQSIMDPKKDILRPGPDNKWGLFLDGNGVFANANSGNMLPTYNAESGGATVGVTYRVNPVLSVGAYTGYEGTYAKYNAGSSLIDNSVRFGLFATYGKVDNRGFYLSALLGGGYNQYQVTRNIQFPGINRTANSQPGAGELDTMLAGGYNIRKGNWTFGPTTSLQYTYLNVNGFNETGAQSLNLTSGGWNTASMLGSLGAQAAYTWQATKNLVVVPQISTSWQHEFMQNAYTINSSMGGVNFANLSSTPLRDFLYTGIGVTLEFKQRWFTSIFYNAAAGNNDLQSQNIFWSFGCKF
jgi:autotransporter-associated beta strand protein